MKLILTVIVSCVVFFALQNIIPTEEEFEIYDATVRLHVIANSDTESDQSLKLKVRDELLKEVGNYDLENKDQAVKKIEREKEALESIAKEVIKREGFDYEVSIEVGKEVYPSRYYEDFALPAGEYTSVKVIIGQGNGQNWWCVLYPPLCTEVAVKRDEEACVEAGLTKEQYNLITDNETGEYKIKFKLLEIASEAFGIKK